MRRWAKHILLVLLVLVSNLLTFNYHDALYDQLSRILPSTWMSKVQTRRQEKLMKAKKIRKRFIKRNLKGIANNILSAGVGWMPIIGDVAVAAATASDLADACEDAKDMAEIVSLLEDSNEEKDTIKICGFDLPGGTDITSSEK